MFDRIAVAAKFAVIAIFFLRNIKSFYLSTGR